MSKKAVWGNKISFFSKLKIKLKREKRKTGADFPYLVNVTLFY